MKFLAKIIEQIEEAAILIDKQKSTSSRLALILTDNVIEILMYYRIKSELTLDFETIFDDSESILDKYNDFKDKTKFLVSQLRIISQNQKDLIDICHTFRNDAYHKDILRDSTVNEIARIYFQTCCDIVPEIWGGSQSIHFNEPDDPILSKHGISNNKFSPVTKEKFCEIMKTISEKRSCTPKDFSKSLSTDIKKRIEQIYIDIGYIESIFPGKDMGLDEIWLKLKSFEKRANKLETIVITSNAIMRYFKIDKELIPIELNVNQYVASIDYMIENATDGQREEKYGLI